MKCVLILLLTAAAAAGQTAGTASIAGAVLDAKTQKPIPVALIRAIRSGLPPFAMSAKSGADGAFRLTGLQAGAYSLCVQTEDQRYLNPCQWDPSPTTVTLTGGQAATGIALRLSAGSVVSIEVRDAQKARSQKTKDGRKPDLMIGVWGPKGLYYPARMLAAQVSSYLYGIALPAGVPLKLHVSSRDLRLAMRGDIPSRATAGRRHFSLWPEIRIRSALRLPCWVYCHEETYNAETPNCDCRRLDPVWCWPGWRWRRVRRGASGMAQIRSGPTVTSG